MMTLKNAHAIFGTVWRRPKCVITHYVNIPQTLVDLNKRVTLAADVMFVKSVPFLVSVS